MKTDQKRIWEIDLLKGLAVIGMVVYHCFYLLDFFGIRESNMLENGWALLARTVQMTFLITVGILMAFSAQRHPQHAFLVRQWRRAAVLLLFALLITAGTFIFVPEMYVRFGILHCIAISIFLLSFGAAKKYASLGIALLAFLLSFPSFSGKTFAPLLYVFGWLPEKIPSIDYFPFFPWSGVIAFGIFLGHFWNQENLGERSSQLPALSFRFICFLGRHSLLIYLLNVPVLIAMLWALGLVRP